MTVHPVPTGAHAGSGHGARPGAGPWSRLAFWLAAVIAVVVGAAAVLFAIAYAVGGADATSDNWVGLLTVLGVVGGLLASIGAFALGVVAVVQHEHTRMLWLPLLLFPGLLAFLVLGEAFWWE